jgi:hypothetical protein
MNPPDSHSLAAIPVQFRLKSSEGPRPDPGDKEFYCQVHISSLKFCPVPVQSGSPAFQGPAPKEVPPPKRSVTHTTSSFCTPFPHLPPTPLLYFTQRISPQVIIYNNFSNQSFKEPKPKSLPYSLMLTFVKSSLQVRAQRPSELSHERSPPRIHDKVSCVVFSVVHPFHSIYCSASLFVAPRIGPTFVEAIGFCVCEPLCSEQWSVRIPKWTWSWWFGGFV